MLPGPASTLPTLPAEEKQALELAEEEELRNMPGYSHEKEKKKPENEIDQTAEIVEPKNPEEERVGNDTRKDECTKGETEKITHKLRDRSKIRKPARFL